MTLDGNALKLKTFCASALSMLGVEVAEDVPDLLSVSVPSSQLDLFDGRSSLKLAFSSDRLGPETEFVVPGSYILDRILELTRCRGDICTAYLRPQIEASPSPGVTLENADTRLVSSKTAYRAILDASFKVSLVTDENEDRLCRVLVDLATGKRLRLDPSALATAVSDDLPEIEAAGADLDRAFAAARSLAHDFARSWADDAQSVADGRLVAETHRLDEYYEELAADRAHGKGQDIRKLQKFRDRAATTYANRMHEFEVAADLLSNASTDADLEGACDSRYRLLDQERRKFARKLFLSHDDTVELSRIDGEIRAVRKAQEIAAVIARNEPESRAAALERMREEALDKLKDGFDRKEADKFSEDHTSDLDGIRDELEKEKTRRVAELRDKFALKVVIRPVSISLIGYPRMESVFTAVSGATSASFTTAHDLVFDRIEAPACDQCGSEMSSAYLCSCGSLVCPTCRRTCMACGKCLCTGCAAGVCTVCGGVLCSDHLKTCDACGKHVCPTHLSVCAKCSKSICKSGSDASCGRTCAICGKDFCRAHAVTCPDCGSIVCQDDIRKCDDCGTQACKVDVADCPSCGRAVCPDHRDTCALCGQSVCRHCMTQSGYCKTCGDLFPATSSVSAIEQILSDLGRPSIRGGRWMISENHRQFVLVRRGIRARVYIVEKVPCRLRAERVLSLLDSLCFTLRL